jgi:hypothetical protein
VRRRRSHTCAGSRHSVSISGCAQKAAVALTELEQNQDKLLPNLRATHIGASLVLAWGLELFLWGGRMRRIALTTLILAPLCNFAAAADYRITQDYGGPIERYKAKYAAIRDRGERVIIDGVCNSACTLLLGIVPLNRVCVTPRASLGFHMPYYDMAATDGVKVVSYAGTGDFMSYYPESLKDWLNRHGGLTPDMKRIKNGPELWAIVDPCPEELF